MSRIKVNAGVGNSLDSFISKFRNAIWAIFCKSIDLKKSKMMLFKTMILSTNFKCEGSFLFRPQYYQGVRDYSCFDHITPKNVDEYLAETGSYLCTMSSTLCLYLRKISPSIQI